MPEAAVEFLNTGGKLVHCTRKFNHVGLSGYRRIDTSRRTDRATYDNVLDKYLSDNRRNDEPEITLYDWAKKCGSFCNCGIDHVPVFTGAKTYPVWPPSDEYSKTTLMCYAKGTWRNVDSLKEGYDSYIEAFAAFLESDDCPSHVRDLMHEAREKFERNACVQRPRNSIRIENSQPCSQSSQTSSQSSVNDEQGAYFNFRESIFNAVSLGENLPDPYLEQPLNTGGDNFDWYQYGIDSVGEVALPENGENWLSETGEKAHEEILQFNQEFDLPNVNVLLANHLQMVAISMVLRQLLKSVTENRPEVEPEQFLMMLVGTAGTGKTFVVEVTTRLCRRIFHRNGAVMNLAPTGKAAVLLPNGSTMHSVTPIPNGTSGRKQLHENPMANDRQLYLSKITGTKEKRLVYLLNEDERSMTAADDAAWSSQRLTEATLDPRPYGGISTVCWVGDHGQLGPVNKQDIFIPPRQGASPAEQAGFALYRQFENVIYLNETMRQAPDQKTFLETLLRVRMGHITDHDWKAINARYEGNLSPEEMANFNHENVIMLCETWNEVRAESHLKLNELGSVIGIFQSKSNGIHAIGKFGTKDVGQIPPRSELAVGISVLLMKNQFGMTGYGLNNGAIGKVVAMIFHKDKGPSDFLKESPDSSLNYVIVDFPNYNGPPWCMEKPTWIPIVPQKGFCESKCHCSREGLPLIPAFAISIFKSQGCTIGENQMMTHMRLKLQKKTNFESMNPGTTYTALSRVDKNSTWSLVEPIDWPRLNVINNHSTIEKRRQEDIRLMELHKITMEKYDLSKQEFHDLLIQIDQLCNDGIYDANCVSTNDFCQCIACTVLESEYVSQ